ncbi:MAG: response regulator [Anaerolineaceae bacterium]|nr:response regulator [Anaerolineaceae bacterium]
MDKKVIILVEDNPDDELLTIRALRKQLGDCKIIIARDGVEALDLIERDFVKKESPDSLALILLDIKLPRLDGFGVLEKLRSQAYSRSIPVVIFTSSSEESDIQNSFQLGCNSFVRKPVNSDEFNEAVGKTAQYWMQLNHLPARG